PRRRSARAGRRGGPPEHAGRAWPWAACPVLTCRRVTKGEMATAAPSTPPPEGRRTPSSRSSGPRLPEIRSPVPAVRVPQRLDERDPPHGDLHGRHLLEHRG